MFSSLLIANAAVLDFGNGGFRRTDIRIENGVVALVQPEQPRGGVQCVLDASGLVVTPGLADFHAHIYHGSGCIGLDPHAHHLPRGVTCVVDQGSAGADNYEDFRSRVLFRTGALCKAFLNCSRAGMPLGSLAPGGDGELADIGNLDAAACVEVYERHRDELLGLKIRLTPNLCRHDPVDALERALAIAETLSVPLVVHPNGAETGAAEILGRLRRGDVFTHAFNNSRIGILDEKGGVRDCVLEARERGVVFDTGHGAGSMSFPVLEKALSAGFRPDIISTDLHNANVDGPVYDLPTTLAKFVSFGLPLHQAFRLALHSPVALFGLTEKATAIAEGAKADIAAFSVVREARDYFDADGVLLKGACGIAAAFTVLGDRLYTA